MARRTRLWNLPQDSSDENKEGPTSESKSASSSRERDRRLNIPNSPPKTEERKPRRLEIPEQQAPRPVSNERRNRRLEIPEEDTSRSRRRLDVPETATAQHDIPPRKRTISPPSMKEEPKRDRSISPEPIKEQTPAPAPTSRERTISPPPAAPAQPTRQPRARNKTDDLLDKAAELEPTLPPLRLRPRIDTVLQMSVTDILDWGNRNLEPLQQTSNKKAQIASELSRIDPTGWLERTKEAACKPPSFLDRFSAKSPSYYEGMLNKTRAELLQFVAELEKMKNEFFREITDLHLDAIALMVCWDQFPDDSMQMNAQNRAKTLLASHQTAAVLQHTIEQTLQVCANSIHQIDSLLSVTIPQWKIAFQNG